VPILGTSPDAIDLAEDRDRFKRVLDKLRLKQPKKRHRLFGRAGAAGAADLGLPLVVRPSYVLGGRAMQIIREETQLSDYLLGTLPELVPGDVKARYIRTTRPARSIRCWATNPLLFDRYLSDAIEIDVDCLCDGKDTSSSASWSTSRKPAFTSGDSACSLPPHSLDAQMISELERQTRELALGLDVVGLMNVQYAIKNGDIYDARSQSAGVAHGAVRRQGDGHAGGEDRSRIMAGEKLADFNLKKRKLGHVGVKESVFPFARFPGVDTVLGPEMRSTGDGDGYRQLLRGRLRQEPARRRHPRAAQGLRYSCPSARSTRPGSWMRCGCYSRLASR